MSDTELNKQLFHPNWTLSQKTRFFLSSTHLQRVKKPHSWRPPTDLFETRDGLVVQVEIAGMRSSDFAITLENRRLTIRGTRSMRAEQRAYHQMEISFGEFSTEVELPHAVNVDAIQAEYSDGFLRIVLPKSEPKEVPIRE